MIKRERERKRGGEKGFYERNYKFRSSDDGNEPCEAFLEFNVSRALLTSLSRDVKSNYVAAQPNRVQSKICYYLTGSRFALIDATFLAKMCREIRDVVISRWPSLTC